MKKIIISVISFLVALFNYFWIKNCSKVAIADLPGTYIFHGGKVTDTLVLLANHDAIHIEFNKETNEFKNKNGQWGVSVEGVVTIYNYSFSQANYAVDLRYYLDFLWRINIDVHLNDTYKKITAKQ